MPKEGIINKRISRSLNLLINYMQLWGLSYHEVNKGNQAIQSLGNNQRADFASIYRYGMKPLIRTSDFDAAILRGSRPQSPVWINYLNDWWSNLHLLFSGSIMTHGIEEHLAVGYNIQVEDKLFHIEGYTHSYSVNSENSTKFFRTSLQVSMGRHIDKNNKSKLKVKTSSNKDFSKIAEDYLNRDDRGFSDDQ
jgi:hypothetical protein